MFRYPFEGEFPVSSPYGERVHPITGVLHFHNGVDFALPLGTPILAPADGVITFLGEDEKSGLYLGMNTTPGGYRLSFAHLSDVFVSRGDHIGRGDLIALSGESGNATGPSLHFRVKDNLGEDINPLNVLDKNGAAAAVALALLGAALL